MGQQVPRAVDDALAAQLGAHLMRLMGPGGDMAAAVKATVDAAMAGSVQRLKVGVWRCSPNVEGGVKENAGMTLNPGNPPCDGPKS